MKSNWWKAIASFLLVLFTMPLGHALMMIMEKTMTPEALHYSAFFMVGWSVNCNCWRVC